MSFIKHLMAERRTRFGLIVAGFVLAYFAIIYFEATRSRLKVFDILSDWGTPAITVPEPWRSLVSDRTAFGLGLCGIEKVEVSNEDLCGLKIWRAGRLGDATEVRMDNCGISDYCLSQFPAMPNLVTLNLSSNPLTDVGSSLIVLSQAPDIRLVSLSNTRIKDATSSVIPQLARIQYINLSDTDVTANAFVGEGWVGAPYYLNMSGIDLSGTEIQNLPLTLQSLEISRCGDITVALRDVGKLRHLRNFTARNTQIRVSEIEWEGFPGDLTSLDLAGAGFESTVLDHASVLRSINVLNVSECKIDVAGWQAIGRMEGLKALECVRTDVSPLLSSQVAWLPKLQVIALSDDTPGLEVARKIKELTNATMVIAVNSKNGHTTIRE
ncbi:leucine-rich repeat domain-containing protein [Schlesneria sp. T3-172]|uniref:leucine-rich repeat domain-containing protein n=1 Tax=Schlesneria sphaerica TaxID=3373610 RepID=UPI0037C6F6BF